MDSEPQDEKTDAEWMAEMEALFDRPFVFWTCPNGCRGTVTWHDNCRYATCDKCGQRSAVIPTAGSSGQSIELNRYCVHRRTAPTQTKKARIEMDTYWLATFCRHSRDGSPNFVSAALDRHPAGHLAEHCNSSDSSLVFAMEITKEQFDALQEQGFC